MTEELDYTTASQSAYKDGKPKIIRLEMDGDFSDIQPAGDKKKISIYGGFKAGFSITIKDSSGCSIMEDEIENVEIPNTGVYSFLQEFPSIETSGKGGLIKEQYEITLTPHADSWTDYLDNTLVVNQYPNPTITLTAPSINVGGAGTTKSSASVDLVRSGSANSISEKEQNWTTVIEESSDINGFYYIKNLDISKATSKSTVIKKTVTRTTDSPTYYILNLKPKTSATKNGITSGDLTAGMNISGEIQKTKLVTNSLEVPSCKKKTNKFELSNTTGLFEGMLIYINGIAVAKVSSIDCSKNITVSKKIILKKMVEVTFKHKVRARVSYIISQVNAQGNACVAISRPVYIPDGMELEFDDDFSNVSISVIGSGSGSNTITLAKKAIITNLGIQDVTYTLDLASMITRKPNAKNFNIEIPRKTSTTVTHQIDLSIGDFDNNKANKAVEITKVPSHGTAVTRVAEDTSLGGPSIDYVVNPGFLGEDIIKYRVSHDGADTLLDDETSVNPKSDEKTITITVK